MRYRQLQTTQICTLVLKSQESFWVEGFLLFSGQGFFGGVVRGLEVRWVFYTNRIVLWKSVGNFNSFAFFQIAFHLTSYRFVFYFWMLRSPSRTGRNANESTVTENMKKKNSLKQVKTRALFPAENCILENYFKRWKKS